MFLLTALITGLIAGAFMGGDKSKSAEPEIHLIPKGFIGHVTICFGEKNGVPPKYENGRRVYEIPPGGTLHTQFPTNSGIRPPKDFHFFYYDAETGSREELPKEDHDDPGREDIAILGGYLFSNQYHYFVDQVRNKKNYKNPAIQEGERDWGK